MAKSPYIIQKDEKSRCPNCSEYVDLLCREDGNNNFPWFYICFNCDQVFQVGKGEVRRER